MEREPQFIRDFYHPPLAMTPPLWDELDRIVTELGTRTALTDLVYGEALDPASKSLRAVEGRE